jgi:L-alanine-DL-glutamate epimerase-like enolase superfamily enzyme
MVGDAAALHLAASLPSASRYCEIGEFELITGDPFEGLRVEDGILKVPEGAGLGVRLLQAK